MRMKAAKCLSRIDRLTWALIALVAAIGLYLLVENSASIAGVLVAAAPWLLLAACPLLHIFMHRSHGRQDHASSDNVKRDDDDTGSGP